MPKVKPGWVLVKIKAFGINRSELYTRNGLSPSVKLPRIIGIECVGEVADPSDSTLREGQLERSYTNGEQHGGRENYCCNGLKGGIMNTQKYLELLREIKDVAFATVDEYGNPQVRMIDIMIVEEEKLYFVVARGKAVHKEILENPNVAITAMTKDYLMIRLSGIAKKAPQELLARVFEDNPSMNDVYPGESRHILDVFCIDEGYGEAFDLGKSPICRESFAFEKAEVSGKGFLITSACIECGLCMNLCPQRCIRGGAPYVIDQAHCLHCGLCQENCPTGAIEKRTKAG